MLQKLPVQYSPKNPAYCPRTHENRLVRTEPAAVLSVPVPGLVASRCDSAPASAGHRIVCAAFLKSAETPSPWHDSIREILCCARCRLIVSPRTTHGELQGYLARWMPGQLEHIFRQRLLGFYKPVPSGSPPTSPVGGNLLKYEFVRDRNARTSERHAYHTQAHTGPNANPTYIAHPCPGSGKQYCASVLSVVDLPRQGEYLRRVGSGTPSQLRQIHLIRFARQERSLRLPKRQNRPEIVRLFRCSIFDASSLKSQPVRARHPGSHLRLHSSDL